MPGDTQDEGRSHLWLEHRQVAAPLVLFGVLTVISATFANNFNLSDAYWFLAGPLACMVCALWYRRQRARTGQADGPSPGLWVRAGLILLAAESLIVLVAVDAPLGVALALLGVGLRLGSKYLVLWAVGFGLVAGLARYAVFNRVAGLAPHHGLATPIAFAIDGLALLAAGLVAARREAGWARGGQPSSGG